MDKNPSRVDRFKRQKDRVVEFACSVLFEGIAYRLDKVWKKKLFHAFFRSLI